MASLSNERGEQKERLPVIKTIATTAGSASPARNRDMQFAKPPAAPIAEAAYSAFSIHRPGSACFRPAMEQTARPHCGPCGDGN